jgi:receptor expression-enhancing protein 5/6
MSTPTIEQVKKNFVNLELKLLENRTLRQVKEKIGFPVVYLLGALLGITALFIYFFSGMRALVHLVAFVYPAWASLKAINSEDQEDDRLWLAYWVFYGFCTVIESVTDLFLFWIPFYELLKMGFYVYLYHMKGALVLYEKLVRPMVIKLEEKEKKS